MKIQSIGKLAIHLVRTTSSTAFLVTLFSSPATAGFMDQVSEETTLNYIKNQSGSSVVIQRFAPKNNSYQLFSPIKHNFRQQMKSFIKETVAPNIEVRGQSSGDLGKSVLGLTSSKSFDYTFHLNDTKICGYKVRAHQLKNQSTFMLGHSPRIDLDHQQIEKDWPSTATSVDRFVASLRHFNPTGEIKLISAERCYYLLENEALPVWKIRAKIGGLPFNGYANSDRLLDYNREFFHLEGSGKIYKSNIEDGSPLADTPIYDLTGDGTLTTDFLHSDPNGISRATNSDHQFNFEPNTPEYDEVASFTYAQQHQKYFESIGFVWYGPKPMRIIVHDKPNGDTNNALFMPAESGSVDAPTIFIGDGDGQILQNLGKDGDVVSHEFSHHVIYKYLKSTKGESLILHEGLADFFVFARTGDACLGESICPVGGTICWSSSCLRTASNNLTYGSNDYIHSAPHQKGQLISGMLWDMIEDGSVPKADLERLVLRAIDFLVDDSGIEHFILALFNADADLFSSKYYQPLKTSGSNRGLDEFMTRVGAPGETPPPSEVEIEEGNSVLPSKESSSKSDSSETALDKICGVTGINWDGSRQLGMLLFFLLPIGIAGLLPKFEKARVQKSKNS